MSLPHSLFLVIFGASGDLTRRTSPLWDVPALPIRMKPIAAI